MKITIYMALFLGISILTTQAAEDQTGSDNTPALRSWKEKAKTSPALAKFRSLCSQGQHKEERKKEAQEAIQQTLHIEQQMKEYKAREKAKQEAQQQDFDKIVSPRRRELTAEDKEVVRQSLPGIVAHLEYQESQQKSQ